MNPHTCRAFESLANLTSCRITFLHQPSDEMWPFTALPKLVHLLIVAEGMEVHVGELPASLKTLGFACSDLHWQASKEAPQVEALILDRKIALYEAYRGLADCTLTLRAPAVKTFICRIHASGPSEALAVELTLLVRLLLVTELAPPQLIDLSAMSRLQEAILLGRFKLLGVPASLQRLGLACNDNPNSVQELNFSANSWQVKVVSLGGMSQRELELNLEDAAAPSKCTRKKKDDLPLFTDVRRMIIRGPFEKLMHDLDTMPHINDAWEELWQM